MKSSIERLQNLLYFIWKVKTQSCFYLFSFRATKTKQFWSISLELFIKHKPLFSQEWFLISVSKSAWLGSFSDLSPLNFKLLQIWVSGFDLLLLVGKHSGLKMEKYYKAKLNFFEIFSSFHFKSTPFKKFQTASLNYTYFEF